MFKSLLKVIKQSRDRPVFFWPQIGPEVCQSGAWTTWGPKEYMVSFCPIRPMHFSLLSVRPHPLLLVCLRFHPFLSPLLLLIPGDGLSQGIGLKGHKRPRTHYGMSLPYPALCSRGEETTGSIKSTFSSWAGSRTFPLSFYDQMVTKRNGFSLKAPIFNSINNSHILLQVNVIS